MVRGPMYFSSKPGSPQNPITTSMVLETMMAPWIWKPKDKVISCSFEAVLKFKDISHLSDARMPDMSRVQWGTPVSINLLCRNTNRKSHHDFQHSAILNDWQGSRVTLARTAPAIQTKYGLGRNEERKGAGLEQRESKQHKGKPISIRVQLMYLLQHQERKWNTFSPDASRLTWCPQWTGLVLWFPLW